MEKPHPWAGRTPACRKHASLVPCILSKGVCVRAHVCTSLTVWVSHRVRQRKGQEHTEIKRQGNRDRGINGVIFKYMNHFFFLQRNRSAKSLCPRVMIHSMSWLTLPQWFLLHRIVKGNSIVLLLLLKNSKTHDKCVLKQNISIAYLTCDNVSLRRKYVCVCVCKRERERNREKEIEKEGKIGWASM